MKRFKTKKSKSYRTFFIILIPFIIFIMLFLYLSSFKLEKSYAPLINYMHNQVNLTKNSKTNPLNHLMNNLDFLISDYVFFEDEEDILVTKTSQPKIYLYNTHDTETYKENNDYNIKATVITASYMLKDALSRLEIDSDVEERRVSDYLGNKYYSKSYEISRTFLEEAVLKNHEYSYFIDVHRDSVSSKYTQITINNKEYAKIMFVLGLENENFQ